MRSRLIFLAVGVASAYAVLLAALIAGPRAAKPRHESPRALVQDEAQIRHVLDAQADAWNRGDIDSFMTYYWKSEDAIFVSAKGVTRGWQAVLDRYHRVYSTREAMGHLTFSNVDVRMDCPDAATVVGQFQLQRANDHPSGVYTLNLRKFPEGWRIVVDHTTAFASKN